MLCACGSEANSFWDRTREAVQWSQSQPTPSDDRDQFRDGYRMQAKPDPNLCGNEEELSFLLENSILLWPWELAVLGSFLSDTRSFQESRTEIWRKHSGDLCSTSSSHRDKGYSCYTVNTFHSKLSRSVALVENWRCSHSHRHRNIFFSTGLSCLRGTHPCRIWADIPLWSSLCMAPSLQSLTPTLDPFLWIILLLYNDFIAHFKTRWQWHHLSSGVVLRAVLFPLTETDSCP